MTLALALLLAAALPVGALMLRAGLNRRADRLERARLAALQPACPDRFSPEMVATLPEPARRYFTFAILPGTPLWRVAEIEMRGRLGLGDRADPRYQPMRARQILAAPEGLVWLLRTGGGMPVSGSDSARWTRFRLFGLVPIARAGGSPDVARSAFGRVAAEAAFWTPAALLPGPAVAWEVVDADTARVTLRHGDLEQALDITVDAEGRPRRVVLQRWSNANPDKVFRLQPFGGTLDDFREVEGFRLPFRVEGGNFFGTEAYFAFYKAEVSSITFPRPSR